jgi:membrane protein implicated in regulation of membrane protease activity
MRPKRHPVNTPEAGLVGRSGVLLVEVEGVPGLRVRLGDSDWPARLPRDLRVPEGGQVRVRVEDSKKTLISVRPRSRFSFFSGRRLRST